MSFSPYISNSLQTLFTQPPGITANRWRGVLEACWRNSWVIGWTYWWSHSTGANWIVPLALEPLSYWAAPPAVRVTLGVCLGYMLVTCCGASTELLSKAGSATESLWLCSLPFFLMRKPCWFLKELELHGFSLSRLCHKCTLAVHPPHSKRTPIGPATVSST